MVIEWNTISSSEQKISQKRVKHVNVRLVKYIKQIKMTVVCVLEVNVVMPMAASIDDISHNYMNVF